MPSETFKNLPEIKQREFINAFLKEFSENGFDKSSITAVVKELGIAKGSVYQYFENKLDLYLYIKSLCEDIKMNFIRQISRADFTDFWEYYSALFSSGVRFDLEAPLESRFLFQLSTSETSQVLKPFLNEWKERAIEYFTKMVSEEIEKGVFRNDLPVDALVFFLVTFTTSIGDYMHKMYGIDFDKNIAEDKPVFAQQEKFLMKAVSDYVSLLKKAFSK